MKRKSNKLSSQIKRHVQKKTKEQPKGLWHPPTGIDKFILSTGSTLVDLAISGRRFIGGGIPMGIFCEIFGASARGKCITGDSIVFNDAVMEPIRESSGGVGLVKKEINTISDKGMEKTTYTYKEKVNSIITIKNKIGMSITGTKEHPVLCWNKDIKFKKLKHIKKGDITLIPREINIFPKTNPILDFKDIKRTNKKLITIPKTLNPDISRLLGYIVANGCMRNGNVSFSTTNKAIKQDIKNICTPLSVSLGKELDDKDFNIGASSFGKFVSYMYGSYIPTARYKEVPKMVLKATKECQIHFLRGLFDCDSWSNEKTRLQYYTASGLLARQVQLMLQNLGILSTWNQKYNKQHDRNYHSININVGNLGKLCNIVGPFIKYKMVPKIQFTDTDTYPIAQLLKTKIDAIRKELGVTVNGTFKIKNDYKRFTLLHGLPSSFSKGVVNYSLSNLKKLLRNCDYMIEYKSISDFKLFLESIIPYKFSPVVKKIKTIEPTDVYDFTIPKTHRFISNGFVSHNTVMLLEMAGIVQRMGGDYLFIDPEARVNKEFAKVFGFSMDDGKYKKPNTIEESFDIVRKWEPKGPGPHVVFKDSLAAFASKEESEDKGDEYSGARKAKEFSQELRKITRIIEERNYLILATNQIRQNLGAGLYAKKTKATGGEAPKFYSSLRLELKKPNRDGEIKMERTIRGIKHTRITGVQTDVYVEKSTVSTPHQTGLMRILFDYGVDDIIPNLIFLKRNTKGNSFTLDDKVIGGSLEKAVQYIEHDKDKIRRIRQTKLKKEVISVWTEIQKELTPTRKRKIR